MRISVALAIVLAAMAASPAAADPALVTVGVASSISDAPIYIAQAKGFFRDEDLKLNIQTFASAANMVAPLSTGELDVGGGAPSAGLYNAIARGIHVKIVADKASSQPGYGVNRILIRKALVESGRYKTPRDLRGMKIAMSGVGVSSMTTLNDTIAPFGVKYSEVEVTSIPFPQHLIAMQNGAIDGSITTDPSGMLAIRSGIAVKIKSDDEVLPGHQVAVLLYAQHFAEARADVAHRFMRAYVRGVRFYNGALRDGHFRGPNAREVIGILTKVTPIKDPKIFDEITPVGNNPDGRVNVPSLQHDLDFFREQKMVQAPVDLGKVVDSSFVDAALKSLGPWKGKAP
jgi:NitT/TauT family transport system substrate-binding protein